MQVRSGLAMVAIGALAACSESTGSTIDLSSQARLGREVFLEKAAPPCGTCHTLGEARSRGMLGPDLDDVPYDFEEIRNAVMGGVGAMPSQAGVLDPAEIDAVARFVVEASGRGR